MFTHNTSHNNISHAMLTEEKWESFTEDDHHTWSVLFRRQMDALANNATKEVSVGFSKLKICQNNIPKFADLNKILNQESNFSIVPVSGFIPPELFFKLLAERKFPSTCFIRKAHQLDYLEEPDIFHDIFGHIPLLANKLFADFMQLFGQKGLEAIAVGKGDLAASLYWFTVEFGLIKHNTKLAIYGAGIISSLEETNHCLNSPSVQYLDFDIYKVLNTPYEIDRLQNIYFVIASFQHLFNAVQNIDWHNIVH